LLSAPVTSSLEAWDRLAPYFVKIALSTASNDQYI